MNHSSHPWLRIRDWVFPAFSELNYANLFWCTTLLVILNPSLLGEAIDGDARILVFIGAAIYLFIRVLGKGTFGTQAKNWICLLYYGFMSWLAFVSTMSLLEYDSGAGTLHNINLAITIVFLIFSVIRFFTTLIIFRLDNPTQLKLITDRFKDDQAHWWDFAIVFVAVAVVMWIVRQYYEANETVLLLTYAYTMAVHKLVTTLVPRLQ